MRTLIALARAAGLEPEYTGWDGSAAGTSDDSLVAMLTALAGDLGFKFAGVEDADTALAQLEHHQWAETVPQVCVGFGGELVVPFAVVADTDAEWWVEVTTERGTVIEASGTLFALPPDSHARLESTMRCIRRATITVGEVGYHQMRWRAGFAQGDALAVCAPERAWGGPGEGPRRWGVFAPVFGLATAASGQAGDLGTLRDLFDQVSTRGGSYVATLPILAQFLGEPCVFSPYSPASRVAWNELYLDLEDLGALAAEVGIAPPLAPPVEGKWIAYREQYRWRRRYLDELAPALMAHAEYGAEIDEWAKSTGMWDYAAFRALGEHYGRGWHEWPAVHKDHVLAIRDHAGAVAAGVQGAAIYSHVVGQWLMSRQLRGLAAHPTSLYLDLPVGVNADAYEVWRHRPLFLLEASAGAPPDALFLGGQDWGLPPLSPTALRRDRYRYLIRCLRHHMQVARMLRIDHVMGLFRLYCVPRGRPATDGVYLRYPHQELLAILVLESHRNQCALVGEDLGTVPAMVRPLMERHGLYRLHVGQWSFPSRVGGAPELSPAGAVASLNTHDTPTFAGWWAGTDIDDQADLGLADAAALAKARAERERMTTALLAFARATTIPAPVATTTARPATSPADPMSAVERAELGATLDLAAGPAEVMLVALDDLALERVPHNVPGTTTQRPNWQRTIPRWETALAEHGSTPLAAATMAAVTVARLKP